MGFPLRSLSSAPAAPPPISPGPASSRRPLAVLARHLLLALLLNGLLLGYVALCARTAALEAQARVLQRELDRQRASNAECRGRLAAVTDPAELRGQLLARGFDAPAAVDRVPVLPPIISVADSPSPSRPAPSPVLLAWARRSSSQVWRALCEGVTPPAEASTPPR